VRSGAPSILIAGGAAAAALLAAWSPAAHADRLGAVGVVAPDDGGYYDALSGTATTVAGPARFAVRPDHLVFRALGVGVTTSMRGLRWTGWGSGHATARGTARFCPDIGPCRSFSGVLLRLRGRQRLVCERRTGDWITHYVRITARLSPGAAASHLRLRTPASLSC